MIPIRLYAPIAGWAAPLDEVPDPVFAERMMGEGLAIDPLEGVLRAPCDAEVIAIADTAHAVTLRLANGAEILIHIGLETVGLAGEGFTARARAGQSVKRGDPLIEFDLDAVARKAKSLITPIVLTNEGYSLGSVTTGRLVGPDDAIGEITSDTSSPAFAGDEQGSRAPHGSARSGGSGDLLMDHAQHGRGDLPDSERTPPPRYARSPSPRNPGEEIQILTRTVTIASTHGLHARPAARIAALAKSFAATLELEAGGKTANVRSPVALMTLGLRQGDGATLAARGADAAAALAAVGDLLETQLDDASAPAPAAASPAPSAGPAADGRLHGVCASPGFAMGPVARFVVAEREVEAQGHGVAEERSRLDVARAAVAVRIAIRDAQGSGIAAAHIALLEDPELLAAAEAGIIAGRSAGFAWHAAVEASVAALRATGNALLIERIDDLKDVEAQLLAELAGEGGVAPLDPADGAILVADNLLVSQVMDMDLTRLGAIATARGGPTSHVAILAASAGVPMLVAAGDDLLAVEEGATVLLDASAGWLDPAPDAEARAAAAQRSELDRRRRAEETAAAAEPCRMADGTRIEVFANLASAAEAMRAVAAGAEGCGLLRTEFLFHDRPAPPAEEEQKAAYAGIAAALDGRPLIVRTLDAGGDKPLPYLALPAEENPALGLRGVRIGLVRPELMATQLRAILRAAPAGDLKIMVPMIVDVGELRAVRAMLDAAAAELGVPAVPLGIMVETPAAALLASSLAAEADFLSIGTNDLSQYALAADRGNPAIAPRLDALHPAVLRLIAAVGEGARARGKWFGICGGVASDPLAAAILIGLGATELSAAPAAIPALKATVRRLTLDACRALAARALEAESAEVVRAIAAEGLKA